ncbi:hypothetical protein MTP99_003966 [Tenebrio molitor]|nr:hypothetical protein MTP99_003966 [Tenebrio molitor]
MIKLLILVTVLSRGWSAFMRNKFTVDVENVQVCPDNDKLPIPIRNMKFSHYNRTHKTLSYDFGYDRPLDENIGGSLEVARWGDGGWIETPFIPMQQNVCKTFGRLFKDSWVSLYKNAGVPHPDRCPIPAGNYSLKNYLITISELNVPFWSGRVRVSTSFKDVRTKQVIQCYIYIVKLTEII